MNRTEETPKKKPGKRRLIGEYAEPSVRWLKGVRCPICGGEDLMDALSMGLCVKCNKFVKPKKG